jgi:hypothetical protein
LWFAFLSAVGASWATLLWFAPLLVAGLSLTLLRAANAGKRATFHPQPSSKLRRAGVRLLVVCLHIIQPAARLIGRVQHGIRPWGWRRLTRTVPLPAIVSFWSEHWEAIESHQSQLESILKESGAVAVAGGNFDPWDLSISGGLFGAIRVVAMVEEHGSGHQLCWFRAWPKVPRTALAILLVLVTAAGLAVMDHAAVAGISLALTAAVLGFLIYADCAIAMSQWHDAFGAYLRRNKSLRVTTSSRLVGGYFSV